MSEHLGEETKNWLPANYDRPKTVKWVRDNEGVELDNSEWDGMTDEEVRLAVLAVHPDLDLDSIHKKMWFPL